MKPMNRKIPTSCIIDNDPIFIYGTRRMMKESFSCETILEYHNGEEALENLIRRQQTGEEMPSVIFLDLDMPIMNGWDFLDEFMKYEQLVAQQIHIYIISSSIDPRELEKVNSYKAVSKYILKPVTPQDLELVLEALNPV